MKKLVLTSALVALVGGLAYGQGVVNWGSITFSALTAQTNATVFSPYSQGNQLVTGGTATGVGAAAGNSAGTGFYYALLVGNTWTGGTTNSQVPSTLSAFSSWTATGLTATNSATAGRLQVLNASSAASVPSPFYNDGTTKQTNYIMLVGWSANLGSTYSTALSNAGNNTYLSNLGANAYFGISNLGWETPASSGSPTGSTLFGTAANATGMPIYNLNMQLDVLGVAATPEPGTMALAALGGASLLLFRRRK
jgi:PEP-CTERM motif